MLDVVQVAARVCETDGDLPSTGELEPDVLEASLCSLLGNHLIETGRNRVLGPRLVNLEGALLGRLEDVLDGV